LEGLICPPRGFPLHEKISSLRSKRGDRYSLYRYIFEKRLPVAAEPEPLQSPLFSTAIGQSTCRAIAIKIKYDRIVHWGIDLRHRRPLSRWERRCSVPSHSTHTYASRLTLEVDQSMGDSHCLITPCIIWYPFYFELAISDLFTIESA
jgi:hypothetical protein